MADLNRLARDIYRALETRQNLSATRNTLITRRRALRAMRTSHAGACRLLDFLARWIDIDPTTIDVVSQLLPKFKKADTGELSVRDLLHLDMAEAIVTFQRGNYAEAIQQLSAIKAIADRSGDHDLMAIVRYYLTRCYWKDQRNDEALAAAMEAIELDRKWRKPTRVALTEMIQAWIHLVRGDDRQAESVLNHAARVFKRTDDAVNNGNILSFRSHLTRYQGNYARAKQLSHQAIEEYARAENAHRNLARTHANLAFICRLQADELNRNADHSGGSAALYAEASEHLDTAEALCPPDDAHGRARTHNIRALVELSMKRLAASEGEATRALSVAAPRDWVVRANANRILSETHRQSRRLADAKLLDDEAVVLSRRSGHRRSIIRALLQQSRTAAMMFDEVAARATLEEAATMLRQFERDYLRAQLDSVRTMVERTSSDRSVIFPVTRSDALRPWRTTRDALQSVVFDFVHKFVEQELAVPRRRRGRRPTVERAAARILRVHPRALKSR